MRSRQSSHSQDLGSSIRRLLEDLGIRKRLAEYEAVVQWDSLVGDHIAKAASAVRITKGVLFVRVRNSVWRNELSLRKQEIMNTVNAGLGEEVVKDIRFQ